MFSIAFGVPPETGVAPTPRQVSRLMYEYCGPHCKRPLGPLYRRYQKPIEPSTIERVSPVQFAGLDGLKPGVRGVPVGPVIGMVPLPVAPGAEPGVFTGVTGELGGASTLQPALVNSGEP